MAITKTRRLAVNHITYAAIRQPLSESGSIDRRGSLLRYREVAQHEIEGFGEELRNSLVAPVVPALRDRAFIQARLRRIKRSATHRRRQVLFVHADRPEPTLRERVGALAAGLQGRKGTLLAAKDIDE
jgi:hypothetical protein